MDSTAMERIGRICQAMLTGAATPGIIQLTNGKTLEYDRANNYVAACAIGMIAIGQYGSPEQAVERGRGSDHSLFEMHHIRVHARPDGCTCIWENTWLQTARGCGLARIITHLNDIHQQPVKQIIDYLIAAAPTAEWAER